MKIVIASDSFKGSMTAIEATEAITRGAALACPQASIKKLALSDGGEGLVDCLVFATGGQKLDEKVTGPLGTPVLASWGLLGDGKTAVIEMAAASGLLLIPEGARNPSITTTYGTGELIKAALDRGCKKIILGLGGSATNDGGSGIARALGVKLLNSRNEDLPHGGSALLELDHLETAGLDDRLSEVEILVACDVDNPLTGERGASYVFGPQKGASKRMAEELDRALQQYARVIRHDLGIDVEDLPGAGAAGGVGAGVVAFLGGKLTSGIDLVIELIGLEEELQDCTLVITGEGKLDQQTLHGKAPLGVAKVTKKYQVPLVVLAGSTGERLKNLHAAGVTSYFSIITEPMTLNQAMLRGKELLSSAAEQLVRLFVTALERE